jgi:hypothetical protein
MTARIVGILFLIAIATYGVGNGIIESILGASDYLSNVSANKMQVGIGAILMVMNSATVVGIGVLMFPILKQHNEAIAIGYVATRIIESVILIFGIISLLSLITLSQEYIKAGSSDTSHFLTLGASAIKGNYFAYQIAMIVLGIGSLLFCYLLYQSKIIPRFLSVWGLVGYAVFLAGALLEILGFNVGLILSIPGGLFEIFFGIWLIVKGFSSKLV